MINIPFQATIKNFDRAHPSHMQSTNLAKRRRQCGMAEHGTGN